MIIQWSSHIQELLETRRRTKRGKKKGKKHGTRNMTTAKTVSSCTNAKNPTHTQA